MTNRIHIDAPTGVIEVEGEKEFVEAQLDKLMPLIQSCGFGTRPARASQVEPDGDSPAGGAGVTSKDDPLSAVPNSTGKKSRRGKVRAPKGQSCADRIMLLKADGYFKEQRTPADIVKALAAKGWTHKNNQVSAAARNLFNRNDLQRTALGKGFAYYWDRD